MNKHYNTGYYYNVHCLEQDYIMNKHYNTVYYYNVQCLEQD